MIKKLNGSLFFIFLNALVVGSAFGQQEQPWLEVGDERVGVIKRLDLEGEVRSSEKANIETQFMVDTLILPVLDDFSTNRQKNYFKFDTNASNLIVYNSFLVNNIALDSVKYVLDTTYTLVYNAIDLRFDSMPNASFSIQLFEDPTQVNIASDTILVWPAYTYRDSLGTLDTFLLSNAIALYNPAQFYLVSDDPISIWMDRVPNVFINNRFSNNPITQGVATFDGIDYLGQPYDASNEDSYGLCDVLTSKPINLSNLAASDSVYLSFYVQPAGVGNSPDLQDSIVLHFYKPNQKKWVSVWSKNGQNNTLDFTQVKILVQDTGFLAKGFQFRFQSYGTRSGSWDIWNLDYVYLNKNRTTLPEDIQDMAFIDPIYSMIDTYTAMPWEHYKLNPTSYMAPSCQTELVNLSLAPRFVERIDHFYDYDASTLSTNSSVTVSFTPGIQNINIAVLNAPNSFVFPSNGEEKSTFLFQDYVLVNPDIYKFNDTLTHKQVFDSYYAYDDGTAELYYIMHAQGSQIAQKYYVNTTDTLKGILIHFPKNANASNLSNDFIKIKVWSNINTNTVIYEKIVPITSGYGNNGFARYDIQDALVLVNGEYYIGWQNLGSNSVYVGLDRNIDHSDALNYSIGSGWITSQIQGSVMMRPDFGVTELLTATPAPVTISHDNWVLFPNPTTNSFTIEHQDTHPISNLTMTNLLGEQVLSIAAVYPQQNIELGHIAKGIYVVTWQSNNQVISKKLILH